MWRRFAGWLMELFPHDPADCPWCEDTKPLTPAEETLHREFIAAIVASYEKHGRAPTLQVGAERAWEATRSLFLNMNPGADS